MKFSSPLFLLLLCWTVFAQEPVLRSKTTVVNLEVSVLDGQGKNLTDFQKGDFVLFENKVKQQIDHFSLVDEPISYSFVIDQSGSMGRDFPALKKAVGSFVQFAHSRDSYNLVFFNSKPNLVTVNSSGDDFMNRFLFAKPEQKSAVWDAVWEGIESLRNAPCKRKVLVIFSDGMDNNSRYGAGKICAALKELDIRTEVFSFPGIARPYSILSDNPLVQLNERAAYYHDVIQPKEQLREIAALGGGKVVEVTSSTDLDFEAAQMAVELRRSFSLGYSSTAEPDGKWRQIRLNIPSCPTCKIQVRSGYYAK